MCIPKEQFVLFDTVPLFSKYFYGFCYELHSSGQFHQISSNLQIGHDYLLFSKLAELSYFIVYQLDQSSLSSYLVPSELKSTLVYQLTCQQCASDMVYMGQTFQELIFSGIIISYYHLI